MYIMILALSVAGAGFCQSSIASVKVSDVGFALLHISHSQMRGLRLTTQACRELGGGQVAVGTLSVHCSASHPARPEPFNLDVDGEAKVLVADMWNHVEQMQRKLANSQVKYWLRLAEYYHFPGVQAWHACV